MAATDVDGRRSLVGSFVRWVVTGFASVGVDVGLLALLHSVAGMAVIPATVIAYAVGVAINYSLNRNWSFRSTGDHRHVLARYATVVAVNGASTVAIVYVVHHQLGVYYLVAKLVAVVVNASVNFLAGRYWVFVD